MAIYTIGDLHLSFSENKPMSIFGDNWVKHEEKIREEWLRCVCEKDLVVLPGDFSWAMYLENTKADFAFLEQLPGKKLLLKGNHDYWWSTLTHMRNFLKEQQVSSVDFLYNNSYVFEEYIIAGTRGWSLQEAEDSAKMWNRENERLKLSLESAKRMQEETDKEIMVFMHYPPITNYTLGHNCFMETMKAYGVKRCFYGHLHGASHKEAVQGIVEGIEFTLVSADYLNFSLHKIEPREKKDG